MTSPQSSDNSVLKCPKCGKLVSARFAVHNCKVKVKVQVLANGSKLVKRYRDGRCYAAVWSADCTDKMIEYDMAVGTAAFFAYNESTGEFMWTVRNGRPIFFKR